MKTTWTELLGKWDENIVVDGRYISRKTGSQFYLLWTFDNKSQAEAALAAWKDEA
jgi:hypothetical protein